MSCGIVVYFSIANTTVYAIIVDESHIAVLPRLVSDIFNCIYV